MAATAVAHAVALKRNVRVVRPPWKEVQTLFLHRYTGGGQGHREILQVVLPDRVHLQDAKQFAGLENAQARSLNKLDFHFNMTLTATNVAKTGHWINISKENRGAFFHGRHQNHEPQHVTDGQFFFQPLVLTLT